jgi:replicative DNA helicase
MAAGHRIGMIFLEEGNKDTFQRLIASELKVNYLKFKRNPLAVATKEAIREVYDKITNNDQLILLDHFGSMPIDSLMTKVKHMVLVEGCKYILLDHLSMVISGSEVENERKELDMVMTALASFCAANAVHLIVVCHINRSDSAQFLPPKGKEGEPFWVNVRKESARGSSALEQCSWNILGIEPEILPDFSRGRVRIKVLKTRFGDSLGIADVFTLNPDTWEVVLDNESSTSSF